MKVKYFITAIIFSLFITGCQVTSVNQLSYSYDDDTISRYDAKTIVKNILRSRSIIHQASVVNPGQSPYIIGNLNIITEWDDYQSLLHVTSSANSIWLEDLYFYNKILLNQVLYDYYEDSIKEYSYRYSGSIEDPKFGDSSFVTIEDFYGYGYDNPDYGSLKITNDYVIIYVDVVDKYYVDITLYDHYDDGYYDSFRASWQELSL